MNMEESKTLAGPGAAQPASGGFVDVEGERYYVIRNVDRMPPFFVSVISSADHWLFVSSSGGLTAGRVSPESALFPYIPGRSDALAIKNAIRVAKEAAESKVLNAMKSAIEESLKK